MVKNWNIVGLLMCGKLMNVCSLIVSFWCIAAGLNYTRYNATCLPSVAELIILLAFWAAGHRMGWWCRVLLVGENLLLHSYPIKIGHVLTFVQNCLGIILQQLPNYCICRTQLCRRNFHKMWNLHCFANRCHKNYNH